MRQDLIAENLAEKLQKARKTVLFYLRKKMLKTTMRTAELANLNVLCLAILGFPPNEGSFSSRDCQSFTCNRKLLLVEIALLLGILVELCFNPVRFLVLVLVFVVYNRRREAQIKYPNPDDDVRENIINYEDEGGGEDDMTAFDITPLQIPVADGGPGGPVNAATLASMSTLQRAKYQKSCKKFVSTIWQPCS